MLRLKMASAAIDRIGESAKAATTAVNETRRATEKAISAHETMKSQFQDQAPLISGYFDMLDQFIEVLRFSTDVMKQSNAAKGIEALTDIIRKMGGPGAGGTLFDKDAYIASRVKELEAARNNKGAGQQNSAVSNPQGGTSSGGLRIFLPKPPTPTTPVPPPSPSTGILPT